MRIARDGIDVSEDVRPAVRFSDAMSTESISEGNLVLAGPDGPVPAE